MKIKYLFLAFFLFFACTENEKNENALGGEAMNEGLKEIYFAGGCFWGMQGYFKRVKGVIQTNTGYANGKTDQTTYKELKESDHAETVQIFYDDNIVSLQELLVRFFTVIDPTSLNKQGNDVGRQYRTGIYYKDASLRSKIELFIETMQKKIDEPILVEVLPLKHFVLAEEYHQDYLDKNPSGYCHINLSQADIPLDSDLNVKKISKDRLKEELSNIQYKVTQEKDTEAPFSSEYDKLYAKGIYVDIVTGKPLFASQDKYDAGCGWPSFSKPITTDAIDYAKDSSNGMNRTEVLTKNAGTHLGHVFEDGIKAKGGVRYCINGASLRFIPYKKMEEEGYGSYMIYVE